MDFYEEALLSVSKLKLASPSINHFTSWPGSLFCIIYSTFHHDDWIKTIQRQIFLGRIINYSRQFLCRTNKEYIKGILFANSSSACLDRGNRLYDYTLTFCTTKYFSKKDQRLLWKGKYLKGSSLLKTLLCWAAILTKMTIASLTLIKISVPFSISWYHLIVDTRHERSTCNIPEFKLLF